MARPRRGIDDPLKTIPASRHPFQFFAMFALGISGISVVLKDAAPGSINALVAPWAVTLWGGTMAVGGIMAIVSAYWPDRILGLLMERIALVAIGTVSAVYGVAVLDAFRGTNGIVSTSLVFGISLACVWRTRQVQAELNRLVYFIQLTRGGTDE